MADPQSVATAVSTALCLAGLWIVLTRFYPSFMTDAFRQSIFELRDRLFDEAAEGAIPFDHPAYLMLRSTMNGFIRFAHRLQLLELVVLFAIATRSQSSREAGEEFGKRWDEALHDLDESARAKLEAYKREMNRLVLTHLIWRSPLLVFTAVIPLLLMVAANRALNYSRRFVAVERLDSLAFAIGR